MAKDVLENKKYFIERMRERESGNLYTLSFRIIGNEGENLYL